MSNRSHDQCFDDFPETCPTLDGLMSEAEDMIKGQVSDTFENVVHEIKRKITEKFREALLFAYEEIEDREMQLREVKDTLAATREELAAAETQIADLHTELANADMAATHHGDAL